MTTALKPYASEDLGFSISLPENWRVITDTLEWSRLAQERLDYTVRLKPPKKPTRSLVYARVSEDGRLRPLTEFEERLVAKEEHEERIAEAERHARVERMATGLFQAEPPGGADGAFLEVTKLQLDSPLTALDLYKLSKFLPENVRWGSRPSKGMAVNGIQGVVYYFLLNEPGTPMQEWPVFFNVYLVERQEGWILSCQSHYGEPFFKTFKKYKPLYKRVISSFRRGA